MLWGAVGRMMPAMHTHSSNTYLRLRRVKDVMPDYTWPDCAIDALTGQEWNKTPYYVQQALTDITTFAQILDRLEGAACKQLADDPAMPRMEWAKSERYRYNLYLGHTSFDHKAIQHWMALLPLVGNAEREMHEGPLKHNHAVVLAPRRAFWQRYIQPEMDGLASTFRAMQESAARGMQHLPANVSEDTRALLQTRIDVLARAAAYVEQAQFSLEPKGRGRG
jgi:hypothetical protein